MFFLVLFMPYWFVHVCHEKAYVKKAKRGELEKTDGFKLLLSSVNQAKTDSNFIFCLQNHQELIIDISLVY